MPEVRVLKIIWFSFMVSIAIFQVVLVMADAEASMDATQAAVIAATGLGPALVGVIGVPRFLSHQVAQTAWILRFACFESMAIFGFVAGFVSGVHALSFGAAALAWLLMISIFPTEERYTAWEVRRLE